MKVFIGGSIGIKYLDYSVRDELDKYMNGELEILIGDAYGVDSLVQKYCHVYPNITVYASNGKARNNVGNWEVKPIVVPNGVCGREFYTQKDIAMTQDCDFGFMVWDGTSKGTLANILRLINCGKGCNVYLANKRQMKSIDTYEEFLEIQGE